MNSFGRYFGDPAPAVDPGQPAPAVDPGQPAEAAPVVDFNSSGQAAAPAEAAPVVDVGQAAAPAEVQNAGPQPGETPEAAVNLPAPGEVVRYRVNDVYADPPRERDALVLVTGGPDETGAVLGVSLGYADAVEASFRPEDLRPA